MAEVKERLSRLERVLERSIRHQDLIMSEMREDTRILREEMRDFKEEMHLDRVKSSAEMLSFKEEMRLDRAKSSKEMLSFKEEMRLDRAKSSAEMLSFKEEMRLDRDDFKTEMRAERDSFNLGMLEFKKQSNKNWGDLANKMGTLVEDLIVPGARPAIRKYFGEEVLDLSANRRKKMNGKQGEFDIVAVSETAVYLFEVKSKPYVSDLKEFEKRIPKFKALFPEYKGLPVIPIFASIRFGDSFLKKITEYGFVAMAFREWEYMDFLNFDELKKRRRFRKRSKKK